MSSVQDEDIGGSDAGALGRDVSLRSEGRSWSDIRAELMARKREDYDWRGGRVPIYVYHDNDELLSVSREAYNLYFSENALGRRAFPSVASMEEEIIGASLSLFNAPEGAAGSFTSGGTESIFLALKSARDYFKGTSRQNVTPTVLVPRTAHPAFDKAGQYLGLNIVRIAIGDDLRVDVKELERCVDACTAMIVGSAPCYPYGVFDSIAALAEVAISKNVWLHVDACLGGFLAPFAREEGYTVPEFDFSIKGVASLSADLHKYGFSARGASVLLYKSEELKANQGFRFDNWPRGTYATETFLGSRPAGSIASAWAVLQYLGRSGYRRLAKKTMDAKQKLMRGIEAISGLAVMYPSDLSIVLYRSVDQRLDINAIAECLSERGWFVGRSREPQALHLALNAVHAPVIDEYLADLREVVQQVRTSGRVGMEDDQTY